MDEFPETGSAWRDGAEVDPEVVVTRRGYVQRTEVPIPGSMSVHYKETQIKGETTIRFSEPTPELFAELETTLQLARDANLKRQNRGWAPEPIDIRLDEEGLKGCLITAPLNPHGSVLDSEFGLHHEDL